MCKAPARGHHIDKKGQKYCPLAVCRGEIGLRLPKEWVSHIAKGIVENLVQKDLLRFKTTKEDAVALVEQMIVEDLMIEDKLDEEVKEILKQYETDIEKERLDYKRLFTLTKQRLVKERNLVL